VSTGKEDGSNFRIHADPTEKGILHRVKSFSGFLFDKKMLEIEPPSVSQVKPTLQCGFLHLIMDGSLR
jgi:hypothetical protein